MEKSDSISFKPQSSVSHSVAGKSPGLPECLSVFWGRRGFAECLCREGEDLAFKANLLLLAFPKLPTLPLK